MTLAARILCRVVDNFGDAGVCWRFARQLAREHGWRIRLTIDRPELLERLGANPAVDPEAANESGAPERAAQARPIKAQGAAVARATASICNAEWARLGGTSGRAGFVHSFSGRGAIAVERWPPDAEIERSDEDILVSAFGAEPPPALRASLAGAPRRPLWVQLEYLSAEAWVGSHHGLRSTKPGDGAVEHFYYPGFDAHSGGLLREAGLFAQRDAFAGSDEQRAWLRTHGIAADPGERIATLFCYPQAPLPAWFRLIASGPTRWRVLVPEGVADAGLAAHFGRVPAAGESLRDAALAVQRIPFLPQDDYDRLLWSADLNFVRGEDSWVRAQWAARPFVWQPYRQEGGTHLVKLRAFLRRLEGGAEVDRAMLAWSGYGDWPGAWRALDAHLDALRPGFAQWSAALGAQDDLCTRFAKFCIERL